MKRNIITFAVMTMAWLAVSDVSAKVKMPNVLTSGMVLQQQTDVKLWGKAAPGAAVKVKASWSKNVSRVRAAADSTWMITVATPAASLEPQTLTFDDGDRIVLDNVLIGEVWFCSGQSNMEMPMRGFDRQPLQGGNDIIARAKPSTPIRMFLCDSKNGQWVRQQAKTPQGNSHGEWLTNTPVNVSHTSATAYYFARYVQEVLDIPVGIIVSTLGGSKIEPWISREAISQYKQYDLSFLDNADKIKSAHNDPCVLYNAKVAPFTNFAVRGFLWYQGESNRNNADIYDQLMATMVKDWRMRWGGGEQMPFYFVEIAPYDYEGPDGVSAAKLREAQQRAMKEIPNCGMASTLDIGNHNFIHPVNKADVGRRLAWWALGQTYGMEGFGYATPYYESMEIKDGKIYINAKNVGNGMCPMWTSLTGFEIAGEDRVFHPAFAEIETKSCRLAVSSKDVEKPVAVRYCYKNTPQPSVYNIQGLPLLPFRTDNW